MTPLSPEEILISIHPDYMKCNQCKRYYHVEKNMSICKQIFLIYPITKCILCHANDPYVHDRVQSLGVTNTQLESVYGNIYTIDYLYHYNRFAFNKMNPLL